MIIQELERTQELVKEGFISERLGNYISSFLEMESHVFDSLIYIAEGDFASSAESRGLANGVPESLMRYDNKLIAETRVVIPGLMWGHRTPERYFPLIEHMNDRIKSLDECLVSPAFKRAVKIKLGIDAMEAAA